MLGTPNLRLTVALFCALLFPVVLASQASDKNPDEHNRGRFIGENVYVNPVLGVTINLPGSWQMLEGDPSLPAVEQKQAGQCNDALCLPDLKTAMISKVGQQPMRSLTLI